MSTTTPQEQDEFDAAWQQETPDGEQSMKDAEKAAQQMQAQDQAAADYSAGWSAS